MLLLLPQVHSLPNGRTVVEVLGSYAVYPKRTWLVWPTLLLPRVVPLKATVKLGVNGPLETGQVRATHLHRDEDAAC